jgi:hypothetical protein
LGRESGESAEVIGSCGSEASANLDDWANSINKMRERRADNQGEVENNATVSSNSPDGESSNLPN